MPLQVSGMNTDIFWILDTERKLCDEYYGKDKDGGCYKCPLAYLNGCLKLTSESYPPNKYFIKQLVVRLNKYTSMAEAIKKIEDEKELPPYDSEVHRL